MAFLFVTKAKELGSVTGFKWSQKQWLLQKASRRGIADPFGMDKGTCLPIAMEFLVCAKLGTMETFGLHMSLPAVHDTMQQLKIMQKAGKLDSKEYLENRGLDFLGKKLYSGPPAVSMQADVSERSGYYNIGFDGAGRGGHQIAAVIGEISSIFDPNYGLASFISAESAATFMFTLISEAYPKLRTGGDMEWYR